jgi:hypothetical protein
VTTALEKYKKVAGTGSASSIGLDDWNGLCDDVGNTLSALLKKGADFDALANVAIGVLLDRINDVLGPAYDQVTFRGQQVEALFAKISGMGVSADVVNETATRTFLTADRRAAIITDAVAALSSGVDPAGNSLNKLYNLYVALKGSADSAHDSLGELGALIDANTVAITTATSQLAAGVPTLNDFRALTMYVSGLLKQPVTLTNAFGDDLTDPSGIDVANSNGVFLDSLNGNLVAGTGGQTFVVENAPSLPKMTSNTTTATGATGYVASASSFNAPTQDAWYAFNGISSDTWIPSPATSVPCWVQLQVPAAILLAGYALTGGGGNAAYIPTAWQLRASNTGNGSDWIVLDSQTGQSPAGRFVYQIPKANQGSYKFYQLYITACSSGGINLNELELLQYTPAFESHPSLPAHTSNSAVANNAAGYTAFSSGFQQTFDAWMAFDSSISVNSSYWASPNGSIVGTFLGRSTPNPIRVGGYALCGYYDGSGNYYPTAWRIQGSMTGQSTDWVTLDQRTGITFAGGERKTFSIPPANQGAYTFHRILIDGFSSATNTDISMFDLLQVITGIEGQTSIPYHTGANAVANGASGYAVSANASSAGYEPYRAADGSRPSGNVSTAYWSNGAVNAAASWTRQFPSGIKVLAYRLASLGPSLSPLGWVLQGSNTNNGTDWVTVDSRTVATNFWSSTFGDWHYFLVTAPGTFTYYRFYFAGQQGSYSSDGYSRLGEVEFLQGTSGLFDFKTIEKPAPRGQPSSAQLYVALKPVAGTININTNLKMSVSRNGKNGTFKPFVLTYAFDLNGSKVYTSDALDLTTLPAGQTMCLRGQSTDPTIGALFSNYYLGWG